ncbi:MAG: hypothetical protein ACK56F_28955, partial [bacterium]
SRSAPALAVGRHVRARAARAGARERRVVPGAVLAASGVDVLGRVRPRTVLGCVVNPVGAVGHERARDDVDAPATAGPADRVVGDRHPGERERGARPLEPDSGPGDGAVGGDG